MSNMDWVKEREEEIKKESAEGYFNVVEGENRIQLLTHCAPLPLVWTGSEYRNAEEGDKNVSVKGVCWVLQDGKIKQAKLPYTVVKAVKELMEDPDYAFEEFPMPRLINIKAKNAGTKEVEYTIIPSPKETAVSSEVLAELTKKETPEQVVDRLKGKGTNSSSEIKYPEAEIDPADIPF